MLDTYEAVVNNSCDSRCAEPGIGRFPASSARLFALQTIQRLFVASPNSTGMQQRFTRGFRFLQGLRQSGRVNAALLYLLFPRS